MSRRRAKIQNLFSKIWRAVLLTIFYTFPNFHVVYRVGSKVEIGFQFESSLYFRAPNLSGSYTMIRANAHLQIHTYTKKKCREKYQFWYVNKWFLEKGSDRALHVVQNLSRAKNNVSRKLEPFSHTSIRFSFCRVVIFVDSGSTVP